MIEAVFLDIDGVLTDGAVYVDASGKEIKRILFDDIDAIFELKRAGIQIGFLTGEDTQFCQYVRKRFRPDFFVSGCKDKLSAFKELVRDCGMDEERACYVGDSEKDIPLLRHVYYSCVPADADQAVKESAKVVLKSCRGKGVIKEAAKRIFRCNNGAAFDEGEELPDVCRVQG